MSDFTPPLQFDNCCNWRNQNSLPVTIRRAHTIFENLQAHFTVCCVAPRIAALTVTILDDFGALTLFLKISEPILRFVAWHRKIKRAKSDAGCRAITT